MALRTRTASYADLGREGGTPMMYAGSRRAITAPQSQAIHRRRPANRRTGGARRRTRPVRSGGSLDDLSVPALRQSHLCPSTRAEQRLNVVAPPFSTAAVGKMRLRLTPTVSPATVGDNSGGVVAELISPNVVVEIWFISGDDD